MNKTPAFRSEKRKQYEKEWYEKNKPRLFKLRKKSRKIYNRTMRSKFLLWRFRAKSKNLDFDLTLEYLESLPLICHYTGRDLTLERNHFNTVSLDRVDSSRGYTKDNVVLCCHMVNIAKNDLDLNEFLDMCYDVSKHRGFKDGEKLL